MDFCVNVCWPDKCEAKCINLGRPYRRDLKNHYPSLEVDLRLDGETAFKLSIMRLYTWDLQGSCVSDNSVQNVPMTWD